MSSPELMEIASPPKESPEEEADEDAGERLLDLPELSQLDSCKSGSMLLQPEPNARTEKAHSPSKRQQSISPSRRFKRRENEIQQEPRKIKRELSTSKST